MNVETSSSNQPSKDLVRQANVVAAMEDPWRTSGVPIPSSLETHISALLRQARAKFGAERRFNS